MDARTESAGSGRLYVQGVFSGVPREDDWIVGGCSAASLHVPVNWTPECRVQVDSMFKVYSWAFPEKTTGLLGGCSAASF
jgi:hypothetical protein